jgi:hypothetical protein
MYQINTAPAFQWNYRISKSIRARLSTVIKLEDDTEIKEKIKESKEWDDKVIEAFDIIKENGPRSFTQRTSRMESR